MALASNVRTAVESGEYHTRSDVVLEALIDWREQRERRKAKLERLREMIAEGEKGPSRDAEEVFAELRQRIAKRAEDQSGNAD